MMIFIQSIISIFLLVSVIPIGWAFEMECDPSKIVNQQYQTLAIDGMKIEYKTEAEATRYLRNAIRKDSVFPWHKISFEGSLIDTQNNIITELGYNELESSILTFNNERILRSQNTSNQNADTMSCRMTFQHSDRVPKSSNLPYEVYVAIVKEAEACIQDFLCKYSLSYEVTKAKITEAKTINAIVDFGVGNIKKYISTNRTVPASIENFGYSMSSITFNEDTEVTKVHELSIKTLDANNMIVKGFYDLTANFSLNNVAVSLYTADELPIKVTGLQVAFEMLMKITEKTCIFTLKELKVFNLAEVAEIDFRGKRSQEGWSLGSWLGSALNAISSTNFLQIKDRVYSMLMFFVNSEIKAAVEKFNWETYVTKVVAAAKESFEKFQVENMEEIRRQKAQKSSAIKN